jgi:predicted DNA-binding transcriptional regulator YafY
LAADYGRIHRLLKILTLIQSGPGWTAERLSRECGVTERTIYRDMKMLEGAGIPYFHDEENPGYRVRRDFFMAPVQLTIDESLALIALGEHIGAKEQIPLTKAAGKAIAKVRSLLPVRLRDEVEQLDDHLDIRLGPAGPFDGILDVYDTVRRAIVTGRALRCRYESAGSNGKKPKEFIFKPYTLCFGQKAWYAYGHHSLHNEVRCLKLNRFSLVELTAIAYRVPKHFKLDSHLGHAWRMIRGSKRYDVELEFDKEFAETLADTHWHKTQEVQWHSDGSITFRCKVDGLDEIVWWVLSMGPHCVVRRPNELAERVEALAQEMVSRYRTSSEAVTIGA